MRSLVMSVLAAVALSVPAAAQTPTVEEIVARHVAARGGRERWHQLQSLRISGRMEIGEGIEVPFVQELRRPDKMRLEFEFRDATAVQAVDGSKGWKQRPFAGRPDPEPMTPSELEAARRDADIEGPLVDYADKGHSVRLLGQVEIDGRPAWDVELTTRDGGVRHHFIDASSLWEVQVTGDRRLRGGARPVTTRKSNFRWTGDLLIPFTLETQVAGSEETRRVTIERVEVDPAIDDARFSPPGPASAESPREESSEPGLPRMVNRRAGR